MIHRLLPILFLLVVACTANAQSNEAKPVAPAKDAPGNSKPARNADAERAIKERRAQARSLLVSLASDARTFQDQSLRARSLARIADVLWEVDAEQGRALFRKGWEAAEVADQESDLKLKEEVRQQKTRTGGGYAVNLPPNLRREVLRLAARHDRVLSEEFLEKLKAQKQEAADAPASTRPRSSDLSETLRQRLSLAQELLSAGDVERALQFADVALGIVGKETINFLSYLREKDAAAADLRYASLLAKTNGNMEADANTVSLLSSYIFTPHLFVTFSRGGVSSSSTSSSHTAPNVAPELRSAFFQTASGVLLRPQLPPDQDQTTSGIEGKYLVIKRLLPLFQQFASPDLAEAMRGQLDALNAVLPESTRQSQSEWVGRGLTPEPIADREQSILDRIDRAKTSADRDGLYVQLASMASGRGDMRARDFVGKIEESELRTRAQAYIDPALAMSNIEKKRTEEPLELARIGDLTHFQKSWVLSQCAKLLVKTDREKAMEVLETGASEARRIDVSDPDRPRALMAVANVLLLLDPARAWDATFEAVKAANSAEGFTGEDGEIALKFQSKGSSSIHTTGVADFDVAGIFGQLANLDYDRAVQLTRGFSGEAPRASATIAIARAVIDQKKPKVASAQDVKPGN